MLMHLTCQYCNHSWKEHFYNKEAIDHSRCPICKDTSLTVRDAASMKDKIDYYAGCPPFPEPKDDIIIHDSTASTSTQDPDAYYDDYLLDIHSHGY